MYATFVLSDETMCRVHLFTTGIKSDSELGYDKEGRNPKTGRIWMVKVETKQMASRGHEFPLKEAEVSVRYRSVEARRLEETLYTREIRCPISIYLGEPVKLSEESAFLPFTIVVDTKPEVASFRMEGEAFVKGSPELVISHDNKPPRIWPQLYLEITKMLSELARYVEVPVPRFNRKFEA